MFAALPEDLQHALAAAQTRLGAFGQLKYADTIGSTNDAVMQLAGASAPEGTAVCADQQTSGRGRRGRTWSSPVGAGVYLSTLLRGREFTTAPGLSTLGAGVAAATAVRVATGLRVSLKWPNDLVVGERWLKLGGILCEAHGPDALIVGIGINITPAAHPPDVATRATSIEGELGRVVDRSAVVVECLAALRELAARVRSGGGSAVIDQWRALAAEGWDNAVVRGTDANREWRGVARDVDVDGALIVERDGRRERVIAGEVVWERRL